MASLLPASPISQIESCSLRCSSLLPPPAPRHSPARLNPTNHVQQPTAPACRPGPAACPFSSTGASASAGVPELRPQARPGATWEMEFTPPLKSESGEHVTEVTNWRVSYCGSAHLMLANEQSTSFSFGLRTEAVMAPPVRYCIPGKSAVPRGNPGQRQRQEGRTTNSFCGPVADAAVFWVFFFCAGERLCNLEEGSPGSGTYTRHGYIFSSLAGCLTKSSENGAVKGLVSSLLGFCLSHAAFDVTILRQGPCGRDSGSSFSRRSWSQSPQ